MLLRPVGQRMAHKNFSSGAFHAIGLLLLLLVGLRPHVDAGKATSIGVRLTPCKCHAWRSAEGTSDALLQIVTVHVPCRDLDSHCGQWAESGECTSNPVYMIGEAGRAGQLHLELRAVRWLSSAAL